MPVPRTIDLLLPTRSLFVSSQPSSTTKHRRRNPIRARCAVRGKHDPSSCPVPSSVSSPVETTTQSWTKQPLSLAFLTSFDQLARRRETPSAVLYSSTLHSTTLLPSNLFLECVELSRPFHIGLLCRIPEKVILSLLFSLFSFSFSKSVICLELRHIHRPVQAWFRTITWSFKLHNLLQ